VTHQLQRKMAWRRRRMHTNVSRFECMLERH
jgi:hypothetical protein